jgi:hypothetical protein
VTSSRWASDPHVLAHQHWRIHSSIATNAFSNIMLLCKTRGTCSVLDLSAILCIRDILSL